MFHSWIVIVWFAVRPSHLFFMLMFTVSSTAYPLLSGLTAWKYTLAAVAFAVVVVAISIVSMTSVVSLFVFFILFSPCSEGAAWDLRESYLVCSCWVSLFQQSL